MPRSTPVSARSGCVVQHALGAGAGVGPPQLAAGPAPGMQALRRGAEIEQVLASRRVAQFEGGVEHVPAGPVGGHAPKHLTDQPDRVAPVLIALGWWAAQSRQSFGEGREEVGDRGPPVVSGTTATEDEALQHPAIVERGARGGQRGDGKSQVVFGNCGAQREP